MKKRTFLCLVVFVGVLALVFSITYARTSRPRLSDIADKLDLTDEQIGSIKDVQYNFRKAEIGLRADLMTSRLELRHLMIQEKPGQDEIMNLVDKISDTQKKLLKNDIDRKLAMKGILTSEQFKKFIRMKAERMEERMEREPKGSGHRPHRLGMGPQGEGSEFY